MKKQVIGLCTIVGLSIVILTGCESVNPDNDQKQASQTETLMQQADARLGMPNIKNFYEKKMMKTIMEDCDDSNLITYAYIKSDMTGKFVYLGTAMGYGLPYGTEYTNPEKVGYASSQVGVATLPQADPNGLFKPADVHATWIMLVDPTTKKAKPVYIESDVTVSPFKLPKNLLDQSTLPSDY